MALELEPKHYMASDMYWGRQELVRPETTGMPSQATLQILAAIIKGHSERSVEGLGYSDSTALALCHVEQLYSSPQARLESSKEVKQGIARSTIPNTDFFNFWLDITSSNMPQDIDSYDLSDIAIFDERYVFVRSLFWLLKKRGNGDIYEFPATSLVRDSRGLPYRRQDGATLLPEGFNLGRTLAKTEPDGSKTLKKHSNIRVVEPISATRLRPLASAWKSLVPRPATTQGL